MYMKMTKIKKCIKSNALRIQKHIDASNIRLDINKPVRHSKIPPWNLLKPEIDTSLLEFKKAKKNLLFSNKN